MIDLHQKDWINHFIVALGVIVGLLLIFGLYVTLRQILGFDNAINQNQNISTEVVCRGRKCITIEDANTTREFDLGDEIVLEFPQAVYPRANLTLIENPSGILRTQSSAKLTDLDTWTVTYEVVKKGAAQVVVKSNVNTASDIQITLSVQ